MLPDAGQNKLNPLVEELVSYSESRSQLHALHVQKLWALVPSYKDWNPYAALGELMVSTFLRDFDVVDELLDQLDPFEFTEVVSFGNYAKALTDSKRPLDVLTFLRDSEIHFPDDLDFQYSMLNHAIGHGFMEIAGAYAERILRLGVSEDRIQLSLDNIKLFKNTGLLDDDVAHYLDVALNPVRTFINKKYKVDIKEEGAFLFEESPLLMCLLMRLEMPDDDVYELSDLILDAISNQTFPAPINSHLVFDVGVLVKDEVEDDNRRAF